MRADLHVHTVYSDGKFTPFEVAERAEKAGVKLLSMTDHDTLNGEEEKKKACRKHGVNYLSGWEISAYDGDVKLHILGYGCDEKSDAYLSFTKKRVDGSYERAEDVLRKMRGAGVYLTRNDVLLERADPTSPIHTMHLARAIGKRLSLTEGEVYDRYLRFGKIAYSSVMRPTPQEAIECIRLSGGVSSLAHPGRIELPFLEREKKVSQLRDEGLLGIECTYTTHTVREEEYFKALAKKLSLLVTGGSDTHFDDGVHAVGKPPFCVDEEFFEVLSPKIVKAETR